MGSSNVSLGDGDLSIKWIQRWQMDNIDTNVCLQTHNILDDGKWTMHTILALPAITLKGSADGVPLKNGFSFRSNKCIQDLGFRV